MNKLNLDKWWNKHKHRLCFTEVGHSYTWDGVKVKGSISKVIEPLSPYKNLNIDPSILEAAGVRGTMVHKWIEDYVNQVPKHQRQMLASYQPYIDAFLKWIDEYGNRYEFLSSELKLFHPYDNYAGTIDALIYDKIINKIVVLDFKTNTIRVDEYVSAQVAGYASLVNFWEIANVDSAFVLYLSKDGVFEFQPIEFITGTTNFNKCLEKWKEQDMNETWKNKLINFGDTYADVLTNLKSNEATVRLQSKNLKGSLDEPTPYALILEDVKDNFEQIVAELKSDVDEKIQLCYGRTGVVNGLIINDVNTQLGGERKLTISVNSSNKVNYEKLIDNLLLDGVLTHEIINKYKEAVVVTRKSVSVR